MDGCQDCTLNSHTSIMLCGPFSMGIVGDIALLNESCRSTAAYCASWQRRTRQHSCVTSTTSTLRTQQAAA